MTEYAIARDVEALVHAFLTPAMSDLGEAVPVVTTLPKELATRFVQVVLDGGSRRDHVTDSAVITVRAWGSNKVDSRGLAGLAYAALIAWPTESDSPIRRTVSIGGPAWLPDPVTNRPRYQATVSLDLRPEIISA